jgi:hypothetical protein
MKTLKFIAIFGILFAIGALYAKDKASGASRAELDQISARGRALYEYDEASWHGTDAVKALNPPEGSVRRYVAYKGDKGWMVAFGHFSDSNGKFLVTYEAASTNDPKVFTGKAINPPREDAGFVFAAAKAIGTAIQDFGRANRPYNTAVLPGPDKNLFVYLYPAQTDLNIYPLGGDVRYLISTDGSKIIERRQMHKTVLEIDPRKVPPGATSVAGFHGHVLSDVPEDTDVFHVLTQKPPRSEYIGVSGGVVYQIATDGSISVVKR